MDGKNTPGVNSMDSAIDCPDQRLRLVGQKRKPHILSVNDVPVLIDNQIYPPRYRQKPVIRLVEFGDFALLVHQQRHFVKPVLGDEVSVGFGRIPG